MTQQRMIGILVGLLTSSVVLVSGVLSQPAFAFDFGNNPPSNGYCFIGDTDPGCSTQRPTPPSGGSWSIGSGAPAACTPYVVLSGSSQYNGQVHSSSSRTRNPLNAVRGSRGPARWVDPANRNNWLSVQSSVHREGQNCAGNVRYLGGSYEPAVITNDTREIKVNQRYCIWGTPGTGTSCPEQTASASIPVTLVDSSPPPVVNPPGGGGGGGGGTPPVTVNPPARTTLRATTRCGVTRQPTITLTWNNVSGATKYRLKRNGTTIREISVPDGTQPVPLATTRGGISTQVALPNNPFNLQQHIDRDVTAGTQYQYVVEAINAGGATASNTISETAQQCRQTPGEFTMSAELTCVNGQPTTTVQWSAASDADSYNILRRPASNPESRDSIYETVGTVTDANQSQYSFTYPRTETEDAFWLVHAVNETGIRLSDQPIVEFTTGFCQASLPTEPQIPRDPDEPELPSTDPPTGNQESPYFEASGTHVGEINGLPETHEWGVFRVSQLQLNGGAVHVQFSGSQSDYATNSDEYALTPSQPTVDLREIAQIAQSQHMRVLLKLTASAERTQSPSLSGYSVTATEIPQLPKEPNQPAPATLTVNPAKGETPLTVTASLNSSRTHAMSINFGDGSKEQPFTPGQNAEHTYTEAGEYEVQLLDKSGDVQCLAIGCTVFASAVVDVADEIAEPAPPVENPEDYNTVRVVYLVPKDREPRPQIQEWLTAGMQEIIEWFSSRTSNGKTFGLSSKGIETYSTSNDSDFYFANPDDPDDALWTHYSTIGDASRVIVDLDGPSVELVDSRYSWVLLIDVQGACNQSWGATHSFAVIPLEGRDCAPEDFEYDRFMGGIAHELGHTFELPHPAACEDSSAETVCDDKALMWTGYMTYPDASLTQQDQQILASSPLFAQQFKAVNPAEIEGNNETTEEEPPEEEPGDLSFQEQEEADKTTQIIVTEEPTEEPGDEKENSEFQGTDEAEEGREQPTEETGTEETGTIESSGGSDAKAETETKDASEPPTITSSTPSNSSDSTTSEEATNSTVGQALPGQLFRALDDAEVDSSTGSTSSSSSSSSSGDSSSSSADSSSSSSTGSLSASKDSATSSNSSDFGVDSLVTTGTDDDSTAPGQSGPDGTSESVTTESKSTNILVRFWNWLLGLFRLQ